MEKFKVLAGLDEVEGKDKKETKTGREAAVSMAAQRQVNVSKYLCCAFAKARRYKFRAGTRWRRRHSNFHRQSSQAFSRASCFHASRIKRFHASRFFLPQALDPNQCVLALLDQVRYLDASGTVSVGALASAEARR